MPTNPGTTNLEAWWSLDEASGTRADSHGSNDLTDVNTVGFGTGKQGNAADFELSNSEYLQVVDNASISMGDIDFSLCAWINAESINGSGSHNIIAKRDNATTNLEYWMRILSGRASVSMSSNGGLAGLVTLDATTFGALSTSTWYFVVVTYDAAGNTLAISVNAGTQDTTSHSGGAINGAMPLRFGAIGNTSAVEFFDGLIDEVSIWKKTLSTDEIAWLYNSGAGRAYADLTATGLAQPLSGPFGRLLTGLVR